MKTCDVCEKEYESFYVSCPDCRSARNTLKESAKKEIEGWQIRRLLSLVSLPLGLLVLLFMAKFDPQIGSIVKDNLIGIVIIALVITGFNYWTTTRYIQKLSTEKVDKSRDSSIRFLGAIIGASLALLSYVVMKQQSPNFIVINLIAFVFFMIPVVVAWTYVSKSKKQ